MPMPENIRKALFLSESVGWSGGAAQLFGLAMGLSKNSWDVIIACPPGGQLYSKTIASGLRTYAFTPFQDYDVSEAVKLACFIDSEKPHLVHAHHPRSHAVGLVACLLARTHPVFIVSRRVSHPLRSNIFSQFKYKSGRIDGYIAVADAVKKLLVEYGVPPTPIATIYSGVDTAHFYPRQASVRIISELQLPPGVPVVGLVGNYSLEKGQSVFLRAAALLLRDKPDTIFLCAGRNTDSIELRNMTAVAGIPSANTRLLGFREDVPDLLSVMSVNVNAAIAGEALSGAVREAMAMKIPVIASDIAGNHEIVKDGKTGLLFPPGNSEQLAVHMKYLLDNARAAREMTANAFMWTSENLSMESMISKTQSFYLGLLGGDLEYE